MLDNVPDAARRPSARARVFTLCRLARSSSSSQLSRVTRWHSPSTSHLNRRSPFLREAQVLPVHTGQARGKPNWKQCSQWWIHLTNMQKEYHAVISFERSAWDRWFGPWGREKSNPPPFVETFPRLDRSWGQVQPCTLWSMCVVLLR